MKAARKHFAWPCGWAVAPPPGDPIPAEGGPVHAWRSPFQGLGAISLYNTTHVAARPQGARGR
eukprot:2091538-Pyramimonas_sp.AAC.1